MGTKMEAKGEIKKWEAKDGDKHQTRRGRGGMVQEGADRLLSLAIVIIIMPVVLRD